MGDVGGVGGWVHPVFILVAPCLYLLPNVYLSVVDFANPDSHACGCRTWNSLDIILR